MPYVEFLRDAVGFRKGDLVEITQSNSQLINSMLDREVARAVKETKAKPAKKKRGKKKRDD